MSKHDFANTPLGQAALGKNPATPTSPAAATAQAQAAGTAPKKDKGSNSHGSGAEDNDTSGDTAAETDEKSENTLIPERFEEQCFLLDAIELFKKTAVDNKLSYKNFVVVDGVKDEAAKLVSKINSRFGDGLKQFMEITPAQYSMLVPRIRLYVQKFVDEKDKVGVIQELKFKDWTDKSSVEEIMSTRATRGDDAGLVSFSYEYDGRDPASTTNMIKANLRMLFTDFDTITKPIRPLTKKEKGMLKSKSAEEFLRPRFLDLILRQPTRRKVAGSTLPYLIKVHAEIGWQEPEDVSGKVFPQALKNYIRAGYLNEYFTLYMLEHDLDFKEDGRVEMSIDFRAQVENVLFNNTDILALDDDTEKKYKEEVQKEIKRLEADRKIATNLEEVAKKGKQNIDKKEASGFFNIGEENVITQIDSPNGTFQGSKEISKFIKLRERQLEYTKQRQKTARYRKFIKSLSDSDRIQFIDLQTEDVSTWLKQLTSANMAAGNNDSGRIRAGTIMLKSGAAIISWAGQASVVGQTEKDTQSTSVGALDKAAKDKEKKAKDKAEGKEKDKDKKDKSNLDHDRSAADAVHGPGVYRIHYMYLGDIMDVACETLYKTDGNLGITRLVSGPVQFFNHAGELSEINLADIPVSLETFTNWIYRNIVAKGAVGMSLGSFLNKLTTDLIFNALGGGKCFNSISGSPSMMMTPIVLNLKGTGKTRDEVVQRVKKTLRYPRLNVKEFTSVAKNNLGSRGDLASAERVNTATYIFLTGVVREENNFNYGVGGFDFDGSKDGIYTLGIGRDRGIVKNIKFSKSDAKYQAEMRIEQRNTNQGSVLGEFRQVYNASVDLVGNTLFKNGQYVKIDPSTMGLDSRTAVQLGLGGYYVITKVEGDLSKDGYQTKLTCKYNSTGKVKVRNRKQEARFTNKVPVERAQKKIDEAP